MDEWIPLSGRSAAQLRARAVEFRSMAESARGMAVVLSLLRLADRFEKLADVREQAESP